MFDVPTIRVGRIFGIPFEVNLSWLLIFGLVVLSLGGSYFPSIPAASTSPAWVGYVVGALTALLFFASIVIHELAHSLVARAEGSRVDRITLFLFGGVAQMDEEPRTAGREFLMASAGPGTSLVLSVLFFLGFSVALTRGVAWWIWAPLEYLAGINFAVAVFNLLPGFPLDGGRVLRSILWGVTGDLLKATRWATRVGQAIGWTMVAFAVLGVLNGRVDLIWFGLIGWFIASLAGQSYRQQVVTSATEGVDVASIMSEGAEYVSGDLTLEQLVHDHFLGGRHSRYPVLSDGAIIGLVSLPQVKAVAREEWPYVRTAEVTDRDLESLVVDAAASVPDVLPRLSGDRPGALLVVREGRLVGVVTRADVIHLIEGRA